MSIQPFSADDIDVWRETLREVDAGETIWDSPPEVLTCVRRFIAHVDILQAFADNESERANNAHAALAAKTAELLHMDEGWSTAAEEINRLRSMMTRAARFLERGAADSTEEGLRVRARAVARILHWHAR